MSAIEPGAAWIDQAVLDLEVARDLRDRHAYACCFYCQQAGEKALKGLIRLGGGTPPSTHYVNRLWDALHDARALLDALPPRESVLVLDQYYMGTRYPDVWGEETAPGRQYTTADADRALGAANALVGAAAAILARLHGPDIAGD